MAVAVLVQGWGERAVFGKIRYMNYKVTSQEGHQQHPPSLLSVVLITSARSLLCLYRPQGCQRKFDVAQFVARYPPAAANAQQTGLSPY